MQASFIRADRSLKQHWSLRFLTPRTEQQFERDSNRYQSQSFAAARLLFICSAVASAGWACPVRAVGAIVLAAVLAAVRSSPVLFVVYQLLLLSRTLVMGQTVLRR